MVSVDRAVYSDNSVDALKARVLDRETPFVVTNVPLPEESIRDAGFLSNNYKDPEKRGLGWYDTALPDAEDDAFNTSALVRAVFADAATSVRRNPVRLWLQPAGHKTLMHYDGNSLSGLNLQVKGRKHWVLVSPHTPLPCATFNRVAAVKQSMDFRAGGRTVLEFETDLAIAHEMVVKKRQTVALHGLTVLSNQMNSTRQLLLILAADSDTKRRFCRKQKTMSQYQ